MTIMEVKSLDISKLNVSKLNEIVKEIDIDEYNKYIEMLKVDERSSVQKIAEKLEKKYNKFHQEIKRVNNMKKYENKLYSEGYTYIAGIDEVGRGPLAGPVVASAVILPKDIMVEGINDSKKLTQSKREELFDIITEKALSIGIGIVDNHSIDDINILNATKAAMKKAIANLNTSPEYLLIDAVNLENIDIKQSPIIKGDQKSISIAAASIIAKVTRDRIMVEYHDEYPCYDFINNKGYGTQKHYQGINENGICKIHRKSFLKEYVK